MNNQSLAVLLVIAIAWFGCSDSDTGARWKTCETAADCDTEQICAQSECRPAPWVGECDATKEICAGIIGGLPVNDPGMETVDWENGRGTVTRPEGLGSCTIGESDWFPSGTVDYDAEGRMTRLGTEEFTYDAHGFLVSSKSDRAEVTYERDQAGHLLVKTKLDLDTDVESGRRYSYDSLGRISRVEDFEADVVTRDLPVEWSADGLTSTDYDSPCEGATMTRDADGYIVLRDAPVCPAFGDPLLRIEHDGGRFLRQSRLVRVTPELGAVFRAAFYDAADRLIRVEHEGSLANAPEGQSTSTTIEWEGGWMRRLVLRRLQTGNVIDTVELEGECWFSVDQILAWTPHGSIIGSAGL